MKKPRGRPPHNDRLTPSEWRIVNAVRHGLKNQEIATLEKISLDGVKYHVANAIAKLGLENKKALKHWHGAPIDSSITRGQSIMSNTNPVISLGQIARSVKNIEASEKWYKEVLQLKHLYTFDKLAFFEIDGTRIMLSESEQVNPSESILYLKVQDIQETYAKWQTLGIHFINAPHMIHKHEDGTEEWMAFFEDLEKRSLGLMSSAKAC
jgi:DNA-binding CsgD family transcriptional regulator/predicted enzyme related to lactoylglutathione lyase